MKRALVLFLLLALAGSAGAQVGQVRKAHLFTNYDVDSATMTYGSFGGIQNDPFAGGINVGILIATSGSSTTVTAVTASTNPFGSVAAGDVISINIAGTATTRLVTARASADSITVNSALTIAATGLPFVYWKFNSGTAATSGWVDVSGLSDVTITVHYVQGDLDALTAVWECRLNDWDTQPTVVYPGESDLCGAAGTYSAGVCSFATASASADLAVVVTGKWDSCRLGVAFASTDTSDAGANLEKVSAELVGVRR